MLVTAIVPSISPMSPITCAAGTRQVKSHPPPAPAGAIHSVLPGLAIATPSIVVAAIAVPVKIPNIDCIDFRMPSLLIFVKHELKTKLPPFLMSKVHGFRPLSELSFRPE